MKHKTAEPYDFLAELYDDVMEHVNYRQWAEYIKKILSAEKMPLRLADLSCGTGSFLKKLNLKNTAFTGSDLSAAMLRQAVSKNIPEMNGFCCSDFTALPFHGASFDVAVALYDSVNYLLEEAQVRRFLAEAERILKPGGILIFDAVTPYICSTAFKDFQESQYFDETTGFERRSWYDAAEQIQYNEFILHLNSEECEELHMQKIRKIKEWTKLIKSSPFKLEAVYADYTQRPAKRKSERAHFVCRKVE